jgi:SAM-dependent methyltransferase
MQSYDPILLENDRYTELLLQRLTPPESPTFHDYGSKPPQAVLDLGCGQGHWVFAAAEIWKTSQFIGFDLVDLTSHTEKPDNVIFVRGNFLKKRLPFANKQFDLVRMANLSLCVSQAKWESLLAEVFRVLAVGGRLELIDDQIIFPYGPTPSSNSNHIRRTSQATLDMDGSDDEDTLDWSVETDSTLVDESDSCEEKLNLATGLGPLSRSSDPLMTKTSSARVPVSPMIDWIHQVEQCRQVETIFENMLRTNYGINPRPTDFLPDVINFIFGKGVEKQSTFHLKLAAPDADEFFGVSSRISTPEDSSDKEDWTTHGSDSHPGFTMQRKSSMRTERNTETKGGPGDILGHDISAKAAGRLGITYSALAAATAASVRSRARTTRTQSPGLVLWPATYLPMSPLEVEMHACKNLHVLLGCKHAIGTYMESFEESDGRKCMDGRAVRDVLWEYECFRRNRFHWPADVPDVRLEMHHIRGAKDLCSTSRPSLKISTESSICPFTEAELTHVRTIHVFEAIKTDDYSLASLQFPRYPVPSPPNSN